MSAPNDVFKDLCIEDFFGLKSHAQLQDFLSTLNRSDPYHSAFLRYAASWTSDGGTDFNPRAFISEDLSAAKIGDAPCIFLGTNDWALKASSSADALEKKTMGFLSHLKNMKERFKDRKIVVAVIPEKDFLIAHLFGDANIYAGMYQTMMRLQHLLTRHGMHLVFEAPILGMGRFQTLSEFSYPDTHLPGRNYIQVFAFLLQALGENWPAIAPHIRLGPHKDYQDLCDKLEETAPNPHRVMSPLIENAEVSLRAGSEDFQSPLGDTWQLNANSQASIPKKVLLLGDSHSSIFSRRKLTYLFSSTFAETAFHWNPCGIRQIPDDTDADYIVLEISQRFIF